MAGDVDNLTRGFTSDDLVIILIIRDQNIGINTEPTLLNTLNKSIYNVAKAKDIVSTIPYRYDAPYLNDMI